MSASARRFECLALAAMLVLGCGTEAAQPKGPAFRLLPLGDSLTEGANGGYRPLLYERLRARGFQPDFVGSKRDPFPSPDREHEGHPGASIGAIRPNLEGWLASAKPDVVVVMLGTNNVAWWSAQDGAEHAREHAELVETLFRRLPNVAVVVASIPPLSSKSIEPHGVDRAQLAKDFNQHVKKNVEKLRASGKKIRFVDVHAALSTSDMDDGVHPRSQAHYKPVADLFADAVAGLVEQR